MVEYIYDILIRKKLSEKFADTAANAIAAVIILAVSCLAYLLVKKILLKIIKSFIKLSRNKWDDLLLEKGIVQRGALLVPGVIIHMSASIFPNYESLIGRLAFGYMVFVIVLILDPFLDCIEFLYNKSEMAKVKPIKGLLQVVKIIIYVIGIIVIVGLLINRSPWLLLSGIGAFTAVLLLIFQNSILGFVAGMQLASNDMVRIGDWVEMPKYNADGRVVDITLHTVKVKNWDNTITTIPSYTMISDSFKNWRGMVESGGRRIKRSIYIDMSSIKFCTEAMLEKYSKIEYISEYIKQKNEEIRKYNSERNINISTKVNGRHLTNIGTFRKYILEYVKHHPGIHKDLTIMVRQLSPTEHGLPIEIYAFSNDTAWVIYESVQSDIFDHILAVIPEFDLKVFQNPSGQDLKELYRHIEE